VPGTKFEIFVSSKYHGPVLFRLYSRNSVLLMTFHRFSDFKLYHGIYQRYQNDHVWNLIVKLILALVDEGSFIMTLQSQYFWFMKQRMEV
jgi:hypothetical protein